MDKDRLQALRDDIKAVGNQPLLKQAFVGRFFKGFKLSEPARKALEFIGMGSALGGGGLLAAHAVGKGIHGVESAIDYRTSKKRLKRYSPELFKGKARTEKTLTLLNTLNRLAPTLARDPVISSEFVARAGQMPETAIGLARDLAGAEMGLRGLRGGKLSERIPGMVPGFSQIGFPPIG